MLSEAWEEWEGRGGEGGGGVEEERFPACENCQKQTTTVGLKVGLLGGVYRYPLLI